MKRGAKSSLVGMFVRLVLALTKCTAGLLDHSFALVADGLESAADVVSDLVVLFGLKLSVKPKTKSCIGLPREGVAGWKFNAESYHPLHRTH